MSLSPTQNTEEYKLKHLFIGIRASRKLILQSTLKYFIVGICNTGCKSGGRRCHTRMGEGWN